MTTRVYRSDNYWVAEAQQDGIPVVHYFYSREAAEFGVKLAAIELGKRLEAIHEAQSRVAGRVVKA